MEISRARSLFFLAVHERCYDKVGLAKIVCAVGVILFPLVSLILRRLLLLLFRWGVGADEVVYSR